MPPQVSKEDFVQALRDLGQDPNHYIGQRLTLQGMCELYEMDPDAVIEAIDQKHVAAHYDYRADTIWIDALDAAHFFYCVRSEGQFYASV